MTALTREHGAPQAIAQRARIVLAAADGLRNKEIGKNLGSVRTPSAAGAIALPMLGAPREIGELEHAIEACIQTTGEDPKPFRWTRTADDILANIQRFCLSTLETGE